MLSNARKKPRLQSSSHSPKKAANHSLANRKSLREMPLSHIHDAFLKSSCLWQASHSLGVKDDTLARFISNLKYDQHPMDFERFKKLTQSELETRFVYTDVIKTRHHLLNELSLEEILEFIEPTTTYRAAAKLLGVTTETLEKFLINTVGADEDVCFSKLKEGLKSSLRKAADIPLLTPLEVHEYFSSLLEESVDHQSALAPSAESSPPLATTELPIMGSQFDSPHMFFQKPQGQKHKAMAKNLEASFLDPEIEHFDSLNT